MLSLQANLYALPEGTVAGPERSLRGLALPTLVGPGGGPPLFLKTLPVTFEECQATLMTLPRCDCEPDGFFLLTGHTAEGAPSQQTFWRLNGHMHEFQADDDPEPRMHRIELSGECPAESFDAVLRAVGWPEAEVVFELVQEGVTLREDAFRAWASEHR